MVQQPYYFNDELPTSKLELDAGRVTVGGRFAGHTIMPRRELVGSDSGHR